MKKSLIVLPIALLTLTACGGDGGSSTPSIPSIPSIPTRTEQPTSRSTTSITIPPGPDTYEGYGKVLTAPVDDGIYIFGNYQVNLDKMLFMNGDIHRDSKGEYPWYATSSYSPTGAIEIKVEYVDETNFTMLVIGNGECDDNDGKYLSVHETYNQTSGHKTVSFGFVDEPVNWQFSEKLQTPVRDLTKEKTEVESDEACLGTYDEYETFSATQDFRYDSNFIAHLWMELDL